MRILLWAGGGILFVLLATANAAGYRYGVSDQAFYIPAAARVMNPAAFPRDAALIDAQGQLMLVDEAIGGLASATGLSLETLFFAAYLFSLAVVWTGIGLVGSRLYAQRWLTLALGAAFTLRHQIPRTSANSFEPYFHPRILAFGVGLLAIAALLRRRSAATVLLVAAAAFVHVTTALWFAVLLGVALLVADSRFRRTGVVAIPLFALATLALFARGASFAPSLQAMDALWLQALASKDTLFATGWPAWAWGANLGLLAILWAAHMIRTRRGWATNEDAGLVWGATALVALFLATLPLVALRLAFPVQLQIPRVFWLVDFVAMMYLLALADRAPARAGAPRVAGGMRRRAAAVAVLLVLVSAARGAYVMRVEHPERALFALRLDGSAWHDAMRWLARQPTDTHVLTDPGHAWRFGTSVRVAAGRDVLLEEVKDAALAIYSRDVASRVVQRTQAIGDFGSLTPDRARSLAQRYDLDVLVTTADLALPLRYRNEQFRIYQLR